MSDKSVEDPRTLLTTTVRPTNLLRRILLEDSTVVRIGSSFENRENLAAGWLAHMSDKVAGTRFGAQELESEWLDDDEGQLFAFATIERYRVPSAPVLRRALVGVDPGGGTGSGNDPTGIVAVGQDAQGEIYVLDDETARRSPEVWGAKVLELCERWGADVVVERNRFGDLAASNIRGADRDRRARCQGPPPRSPVILEVVAADSKEGRAAPIAASYARGQIHHVGRLARLEDEMVQWVPGRGRSPNGVDALCHAATKLLGLDQEHAPQDIRRQVAAAARAVKAWSGPETRI